MKMKLKTADWFVWPGFGQISLASFLMCALSGIALAVPFDAADALHSIQVFTLLNPFAVFFRNLHYWTAQLFLLSTLIHAWQYLKPDRLLQIRSGIWMRLVLSLFFLFYVMLSGFILKNDADSEQAFRILRSLTQSVPLIGDGLTTLFLKNTGIIYVHHIATASLALVLVIMEHSRLIWSKYSITVLILTGLLSFFVHPPAPGTDPEVMKGPWYFLGLQELLHFSPHVWWILIGFAVLFAGLFLFQRAGRRGIWIRRILAIVLTGYLLLSLNAAFFRGDGWRFVVPWKNTDMIIKGLPRFYPVFADQSAADSLRSSDIPLVNQRPESCLICHAGMQGLDKSHDLKALGCSSCHGGDPLSVNASVAHSGMILVPGNLEDASGSCGQAGCHAGIPERMNQSLMSTLSGMIGVNRWVFGEVPNPDIPAHVAELTRSPADMHLRNLCAGCHLGQKKEVPGSLPESFKGGGCLACHLDYKPEYLKWVDARYAASGNKTALPEVHPGFSARVGNEKCFDCHNRSGRIATNYEGWYESLDKKENPEKGKTFRIVDDYRVFYKTSEDVHHTAGLSCIDCHGTVEVMGHGRPHHKEEAVYLQCSDCHTKRPLVSKSGTQPDSETRKLLNLNPFLAQNGPWLKTKKGGFLLSNVHMAMDTGLLLTGKISGKRHAMKAPLLVCEEGGAHSRLSCQTCHTAWAPTCLGCHTTYEQGKEGYDHLKNRPVRGTWTELAGEFGMRPPSLGVREEPGGKSSITTFVPGMIMTLDTYSYTGKGEKRDAFVRLYAPADPHTTLRKARGCKDCHLNPVALGYGEGHLEYRIDGGKGRWEFTPAYETLAQDGLPADAWIGFLKESATPNVTRTSHRAFTVAEQRRILKVGTCLSCHEEDSKVMQNLVRDYQKTYRRLSKRCVVSGW